MVERTMVGEDEVTVTSGLHAQAERAKKKKRRESARPRVKMEGGLPRQDERAERARRTRSDQKMYIGKSKMDSLGKVIKL